MGLQCFSQNKNDSKIHNSCNYFGVHVHILSKPVQAALKGDIVVYSRHLFLLSAWGFPHKLSCHMVSKLNGCPKASIYDWGDHRRHWFTLWQIALPIVPYIHMITKPLMEILVLYPHAGLHHCATKLIWSRHGKDCCAKVATAKRRKKQIIHMWWQRFWNGLL